MKPPFKIASVISRRKKSQNPEKNPKPAPGVQQLEKKVDCFP